MKLTPKQIEKMKLLREGGYTHARIAKIYSVSKKTAIYHTNPLFRFKDIRAATTRENALWHESSLYRQKKQERRKEREGRHIEDSILGKVLAVHRRVRV